MYLQIYSFHHCLFLLKLVRILLVARVFVPICRKKIDQSAAGFSHYNRNGTWPHFFKTQIRFSSVPMKVLPTERNSPDCFLSWPVLNGATEQSPFISFSNVNIELTNSHKQTKPGLSFPSSIDQNQSSMLWYYIGFSSQFLGLPR